MRLLEVEQVEFVLGAKVLQLKKPQNEPMVPTPQFVRAHFD